MNPCKAVKYTNKRELMMKMTIFLDFSKNCAMCLCVVKRVKILCTVLQNRFFEITEKTQVKSGNYRCNGKIYLQYGKMFINSFCKGEKINRKNI